MSQPAVAVQGKNNPGTLFHIAAVPGTHASPRRARGLQLVAALLALVVLMPVHAAARGTRHFDIGSQMLSAALSEFARQSDRQILFSTDVVDAKRTDGIRGELEPEAALRQLLKGTDLTYRVTADNTILVDYPRAGILSEDRRNIRIAQNAPGAGGEAAGSVTADSSRDSQQVLEEVIVTGTNIRGVAPVGSSLTAVGRAELLESGSDTVFEALQQVPALSLLGMNEFSRGSQGGSDNLFFQSSLNLRGIGPQATLTLLDSHRVPPSERGGINIDPSFFPALAIERAEILADGASAIYGSDAVAGVVNFILRRDLDGVEAAVRGGFADGYNERSAEAAMGRVWDSGQFMLALATNYHSNLEGFDRDYNTSDLRRFGGSNFRNTTCTPGTISIGSTTYAVPNGAPTPASLIAGTSNLCDQWTQADLIPEQRRDAAIFTFTQEFSDSIKLIGEGYAARRTSDGQYEQSGVNLTIPDDHAYFVLPAGVTLASVPNCTLPALAGRRCYTVSYNPTDVYGLRHAKGEVDYYHLRTGLDIQLPREWQLQLSGSYGLNDISSISNTFSQAAITAGTTGAGRTSTATAFDPFGGRTSAATAATVLDWYFNGQGKNELTSFAASVNGSLFELPGGSLKSAFGVEWRKEHSESSQVNGPAGSPATFTSSMDRDVTAAYGEIVVPVIGADNALPGAQALDFSVAGRWERYSDFGNTSNPKIGVNWSPLAGLKVRGSYGKSFRAPTAKDLVGLNAPAVTYFNVADPQAGGAQTSVLFVSAPNPNVQPERARTYSFGVDFTPQALPGLKLSATWFDIDYTDKIDSLFLNTSVLLDQALYPNIVRRTTNPADYLAYEGRYTLLGQSRATTAVAIIDSVPQNLGQAHASGFDFSLGYLLEAGSAGNFNFMLNGTQVTKYDVKVAADAPSIDRLDTYGNPISLRMRGGVSWRQGGFSAGTFANYTGGYEYLNGGPVRDVNSWTTVDALLSYSFGGDNSWVKDLKLALNVNNVFDKDPPFINLAPSQYNAGGYDAQIASPAGREIAVSLSKRW